MSAPPRRAVLVIAGSDSSGGAGLLRDLRTLNDFSVDALAALTAVTAQSDTQVTAIQHLPAFIIQQQIAAAFATRPISAIKIGMLGTRATVEAVLASLPSRNRVPIVLDPVLMSSSGSVLLDEPGMVVLRNQLLSRVTLVTPNIPEAAALLQTSIAANEDSVIAQAVHILRMGPQAVLIKGGHANGNEASDLLVTESTPPLRLTAARMNARMRGTGCALASAIAALLGQGASLAEACQRAKLYVLDQLTNAGKVAFKTEWNPMNKT